MHDRTGRPVQNGDTLLSIGSDGKITGIGVLHDAVPGNEHCNGSLAPIATQKTYACLCDCIHVDSLAAILTEKGLDKRPAGK